MIDEFHRTMTYNLVLLKHIQITDSILYAELERENGTICSYYYYYLITSLFFCFLISKMKIKADNKRLIETEKHREKEYNYKRDKNKGKRKKERKDSNSLLGNILSLYERVY